MVSSAVASVNAWIHQAEEVLAELSEQGLYPSSALRGRTPAGAEYDFDDDPATDRVVRQRPVLDNSFPEPEATEAEWVTWATGFLELVFSQHTDRAV